MSYSQPDPIWCNHIMNISCLTVGSPSWVIQNISKVYRMLLSDTLAFLLLYLLPS